MVKRPTSLSRKRLEERIEALQDISVEIMSPRPLKETLGAIVRRAVDLLVCDAGSLYLKSGDQLFFEVALNDSLLIDYERHPIAPKGLAYYAFQTGQSLRLDDVAEIPANSPYSFDASFDERSGYLTKSVLLQPLRTAGGEVLGVIQLINRKRGKGQPWPSRKPELVARMPGFDDHDQRLLESFGSIAAVAIENAKLHKDIRDVFEGFVTASVHAIESRDLATRGHSERVAHLTVDLARKRGGFNDAQISEIRYASLLHDFGKIGVSEGTLQKEEKLSKAQRQAIRTRFDGFKSAAEIRVLRDYLGTLMAEKRAPSDLEMARLEKQIRDFGGRIEDYWALVLKLNEPSILDEDKSAKLAELTHIHCVDCHGHEKPLLEEPEAFSLKIKRGSLTDQERLEIESHVTHTYEYLRKIPWTRDLSGIPEIAWAHHERLDGTGYPRKIKGESIPVQSKIMAVCDVFDALVANDRPYKPALSLEKTLDILVMQGTKGQLDPGIVQTFIEARVFEQPDFVELCPEMKRRKAA
jgi:HD-GYP domain-containing protein (c-di-GMP phosphodiesterase class II)